MIIPVRNVGQVGVVKDLPAYSLPINAWTDASGVAFRRGTVSRLSTVKNQATAPIVPYAVITYGHGTWLVCGTAKVYTYRPSDATPWVDRTRTTGGDYTGNQWDEWVGTHLATHCIITNGVDVPQVIASDYPATQLQDLPNWQTGVRAKVIRAFGNYLVACNIRKNGVPYQRMVKWSNPAAPGSLPDSWDESVASNDAGETVLGGGSMWADPIEDCAMLSGNMAVYTRSQTWLMNMVGPPFIFSFEKRFSTVGVLGSGCIVPILDSHFVVGQDDIVVHNGRDVESKCDNRIRRYFYNQIPLGVRTNSYGAYPLYTHVKAVALPWHREIWVMYPVDPENSLCHAIVWNWATDTWTYRELPGFRIPAFWNMYGALAPATAHSMLAPNPANSGIYDFGYSGFSSSYESIVSYVERVGLSPVLMADGTVQQNDRLRKLVTRVIPLIEAPYGSVFKVTVGSQAESLTESIVWQEEYPFVVGNDKWVEPYVEGRYIGVRITSEGNYDFDLHGYDLDVSIVGEN